MFDGVCISIVLMIGGFPLASIGGVGLGWAGLVSLGIDSSEMNQNVCLQSLSHPYLVDIRGLCF